MTSRNTKIARNEERKEVGRRENTVKDFGGPVAYPVLSLIPGSHDHPILNILRTIHVVMNTGLPGFIPVHRVPLPTTHFSTSSPELAV